MYAPKIMYAPYFGTALYLNDKELEVFKSNYCKINDISQEYLEQMLSLSEALFSVDGEELDVSYLIDIDGSCEGIGVHHFTENGNAKTRDFVDSICAFWADRSTLNPCAPNTYTSIDELVQEFKTKLSAYLPDDFNYRKHLGFVSYCRETIY